MNLQNKANDLVQRMKKEDLKLALAESITCGFAAAKLSSCVGVSDVLTASIVCYTPQAKMQVLNVKKTTIKRFTCESIEVTRQMAHHLPKLIDADVYAAVTGLASSNGEETAEKPVGTVFFSIYHKNKNHDFQKVFKGTPLQIKTKAAMELYHLILKVIS